MTEVAASTKTGIPTEIADSVFVSEQTFDGMTVRGGVVVGTHRAVIFDTLVLPVLTKKLLSLCPNREVIAVYSHADWDHVWGTCGLPGVEVVAHEECAARFADPSDVQHIFDQYRTRYETELEGIAIIPPQRTFSTSLTLDLGGLSVELLHCPGHTKDSIVAVVPERSLLLAADCLETPLPLLNEDARNVEKWLALLSQLVRDPRITTCVPSHGRIGGREILQSNITYLNALVTGEESPPLPIDCDAFYVEAHKENLRKAAEWREGENR